MTGIGENLKFTRKRKNILQKDVADFLRVPLRTYQSYEYGEAEPNIENLRKLADFFQVSVDYLLGRKNYWINDDGNITVKTTPDIFNSDDMAKLKKNTKKK
ncbi:hypothetical protein FACS1894188_09040 [Clostridia bacterium]|nr:hypothetical protein FACS1894188_09040 [Clostridia bacterium]